MKRVTPLQGVHNFRTWSGYIGHDGKRVRDGFFRSGHFARSSEQDREYFAGLNVSVVADFRRPREREREPSPWLEAPKLRVISSDQDNDGEPPHLKFLREGKYGLDAINNYMMSAYRRIPMQAGNQSVFRDGFRALANGEADNGLLVHCAAGKDRTGIFCALVLGELGVSDADIMADYLMTNDAVDFDALIPNVQKSLKDGFGVEMPADEMRVFLGVQKEFLDEAHRVIGPRETYLRDVLGITDEERDALRARWLVE
ncbi:MAG: tyrosine-protein phosphatase [Maricaulis sp.]|jgi:protein-tyrosine phosphatase|nr:tyrosine-protein phosphatase [Maricaulis sp.]